MKRIILREQVACVIDDEDADLADLGWYVSFSGPDHPYAERKIVGLDGARKNLRLHRVIAERAYGPLGRLSVDHMNGDTLDNRRENLRVVRHRENIRNRSGANKNSSTGVLGVRQRKGRWSAYIMLPDPSRASRQRMLSLGTFDTLQDAVKARLEAEREHWGVQPRRADAHSLSPALASTGVRC
jgi:hypothetical protein